MKVIMTCLAASSVVLGITLEKRFQIYDKVSGKVSQLGSRFVKKVDEAVEEGAKEEEK